MCDEMKTRHRPRLTWLLLSILLVAGCKSATSHLRADQTSELSVYTYPSCTSPSVNFRELKDARHRNVAAQPMPLRVRSGVYAIGLSCGIVLHSGTNACTVPPQDDATIDVPTYNLILMPRVSYEFACRFVNGAWTYTMVENAF